MKRFWEIDAIRGFFVVLMAIYHGIYLLVWFRLIEIDLYSGWIWFFPRFIAGSFIFIMGLSLTLSHFRAKNKVNKKALFFKFLKRGFFIIGLGFLVTLGTALVFGAQSMERVVFFGILHMIGLSIILAFPLVNRKWLSFFLGIVVLGAGVFLGNHRFSFYGLLWLGFRPLSYAPVDYLPLLPWFAFVCLGIFTGHILYPQGVRRFVVPEIKSSKPLNALLWIGTHSLWIYLAHVPVVYGVLLLVVSVVSK
ncbi:MAG: DUF1624 domain-containing protein [Spirochaetales bacterium]|nr:DUF1624 domain-containing protein [Spirochaetales bacterium]